MPMLIKQSSFSNFLSSPFHISSATYSKIKISQRRNFDQLTNFQFDDCIFTNCQTGSSSKKSCDQNGGAIFVESSTNSNINNNNNSKNNNNNDNDNNNIEYLLVNRCGFRNCSATNDGGAIYAIGVDVRFNSLQFNRCCSKSKGGCACIQFYLRSKKCTFLSESVTVNKGSGNYTSNLFISMQNLQINFLNTTNCRSKNSEFAVASISHSTFGSMKFIHSYGINALSLISLYECSEKLITKYFIFNYIKAKKCAISFDRLTLQIKCYRFHFENVLGLLMKVMRSNEIFFIECVYDKNITKNLFDGIQSTEGFSGNIKKAIEISYDFAKINEVWNLGNSEKKFSHTFIPSDTFLPSNTFIPTNIFTLDKDMIANGDLFEKRKFIRAVSVATLLLAINELVLPL